ncbi:nicotinate-nucleotide adenylyltransferase [Chloroflexota bacterium]
MNIGVFGGTFDPIHKGHLAIAEEARTRLNIETVFIVPAGHPWQKEEREITPVEHRLEMVKRATSGIPYFKLATWETERSGPTYTIDTIAALREELSRDAEIFFILGWDSLIQLHEWHEAERLIQLCYLVAVPRPGYPRPKLKSLEKQLPGLRERAMLLDEPLLDVSATAIRERVAKGLSVRHLVPEPVNRYIKEHRLYQP